MHPTAALPPIERLREIRILVIDDDPRLAHLLESVLQGLGFSQIKLCHDGDEALQFLKNHPIDLVICDWQMQAVSGIELVCQLREDETALNRLTPIIMLSGHSDIEHIKAARDAGITEYLTKPFTAHTLCNRLSHVIEHPRHFIASPYYSGHDRRRKHVPVEYDRRKK